MSKRNNGFLLTDVLIAVVVGVSVFLPVLMLMEHTIQVYESAEEIRIMAMYGRVCMEEQRNAISGSTKENQYEVQGRIYKTSASCREMDETYCLHEIKVVSESGRTYVCRRLSRKTAPS